MRGLGCWAYLSRISLHHIYTFLVAGVEGSWPMVTMLYVDTPLSKIHGARSVLTEAWPFTVMMGRCHVQVVIAITVQNDVARSSDVTRQSEILYFPSSNRSSPHPMIDTRSDYRLPRLQRDTVQLNVIQ